MLYLVSMRSQKIPAPLELAKLFRVPQIEVALRLRVPVTESWLRVLALRPDRADEIRLAELEAIVAHLRVKQLVESALPADGQAVGR